MMTKSKRVVRESQDRTKVSWKDIDMPNHVANRLINLGWGIVVSGSLLFGSGYLLKSIAQLVGALK